MNYPDQANLRIGFGVSRKLAIGSDNICRQKTAGENLVKKWANLFTMPKKDGRIETGMARCRVFSWLL